MKKGILKNNKGVSLVLLALSIVVLFGFSAVAIDAGHLYNVKNQLQAGADASALAGAKALTGNDLTQTAARNAAIDMAAQNYADVSYSPTITTAPVGSPIPITLFSNDGNNENGDIVVGNWNNTEFRAGVTPINAVKVVARRTGNDPATQPFAQNWFAKVFSLLPGDSDFSFANVSAEAIAARGKIPFLPIAVNEYWNESECDEDGCPEGKPYNQAYPESFMRELNADDTTPGKAGTNENIFAILGVEANANQAGFNLNSFVDILLRNEYHDGRPPAWYEVKNDVTTGNCSPTCGNNLNKLADDVRSGDVNNSKYADNFSYLFKGIPDSVIPPNAVREVIRGTPFYTFNNYTSDNGNDPSNCPYATIPYYSSSGSGPVNKKFDTDDDDFAFNNTRFWQRWPQSSDPKFLVMVYDGTHAGKDYPNQADVVTIVGYGIIEIDGYRSGPFNGKENSLGFRGNTAYGHALPHKLSGVDANVADVSDPYIIQPPRDTNMPPPLTLPSPHQGTCEFIDILRLAQETYADVQLVDPNLKYGVHTTSP